MTTKFPVAPTRLLALLSTFALATPVLVLAQGGLRNGTGQVADRYAQLCANCHGKNLEGGQALSLLRDEWTHGGDDESIANSIRKGYPEKGMPPWDAALAEKDIRAMVIFIREMRAKNEREHTVFAKPPDSVTAKSQLHDFTVNTWIDGLTEPWSMAFLPGNRAVITEKRGKLWLVEKGKVVAPEIAGVPTVDTKGQAGLFDVVPHPKYAENGWLYLAYADIRDGKSLTRIVRGRLRDGKLADQETIFEAPFTAYPNSGGVHFGGRIAFDNAGFLFFTIGERGTGTNAQDLSVPMGKVHRIRDDGKIPDDNPFAQRTDVARTIWSFGHRNPQGLAYNRTTGELYDVEHGPRGGDEVNLVKRGLNYGWPLITYGMDYSGAPMPLSEGTAKAGMEQPVKYWVPSIAPCGANFYDGAMFPRWKGNLFVSSLAAEELHRLEIRDGKVLGDEVLFKGLGRIRHVIGGPDGALYVLMPQRIARIAPVAN